MSFVSNLESFRIFVTSSESMSFLTAKKTKKEETKKKEKKSMSSKVQVPALKQFDLEVPCYKVDLSSQIDFQWRTSSRVGLD